MLLLITGLVLFFAIHLVRVLAPGWREEKIASWGELKWKVGYSIVSLIGFLVLIRGFRQARVDAAVLYTPPDWTTPVASILLVIAAILLVATYLPAGRIKQATKHPFLAAVKIWAFAHLLVNGDLASVILFGSFLAYAVGTRISAKRRGLPAPVAGPVSNDIIAVVSGLAVWALIIFWLHLWLFGVNPIA